MAERILLASQYHSSMLTHWTDELYCTRRKDRKYSLRERKVGDGGRHWFPGTNNIQTAQQFIDAYDGLEHVNTDGWDFQVDILPKIFLLDPLFGFSVEKELKVMDLEEETERRIGQFIALIMRNAEIQAMSKYRNWQLMLQRISRRHTTWLSERMVEDVLTLDRLLIAPYD